MQRSPRFYQLPIRPNTAPPTTQQQAFNRYVHLATKDIPFVTSDYEKTLRAKL